MLRQLRLQLQDKTEYQTKTAVGALGFPSRIIFWDCQLRRCCILQSFLMWFPGLRGQKRVFEASGDGTSCAQYESERRWVMSGTTKLTATWTDGWQNICRRWAEAGETFEIHGMGPNHFAYCMELCETFNYECHYQSHGPNSTAVFTLLH